VLRVAQSVQAVCQGEAGSEAVVDEEVFEMRQQVHAVHGFTAAFGIEVVAGEPLGPDDVQPNGACRSECSRFDPRRRSSPAGSHWAVYVAPLHSSV